MRNSAAALLDWYRISGVDEITHMHPANWFAQSQPGLTPEPESATPPKIMSLRESLPVSDFEPQDRPQPISVAGLSDAKALAAKATTLDELEASIRGFEGCALKRTARNTVFADGNRKSKILLIGEAPGEKEDAQGIPFCGPSGALLDKMLGSIGLDRTKCLITNTIYWRPPGNRQPSPEEVLLCKPFVEKSIELVDPALIILVGGTAAKTILGTDQGISRLRGRKFTFTNPTGGKTHPAALIFHPSYLLRQPAHKRLAWHDLLMIEQWLEDLKKQS
jgi:uracil-DNA glycosylase family 4